MVDMRIDNKYEQTRLVRLPIFQLAKLEMLTFTLPLTPLQIQW